EKSSASDQTTPASRAARSVSEIFGIILRAEKVFITRDETKLARTGLIKKTSDTAKTAQKIVIGAPNNNRAPLISTAQKKNGAPRYPSASAMTITPTHDQRH